MPSTTQANTIPMVATRHLVQRSWQNRRYKDTALISLLAHRRCHLPVFWAFDQTVHTTLRNGNQSKGETVHYMLMETPYYAERIPNNAGQYGSKMHPVGYLSLGFDGLQGRALQWKGMPPDRWAPACKCNSRSAST
eukprot:469813-Prorocentrum_minimum.AAC.2